MIRQVFLERSTYADLPNRFEAGTPNIADAAAFGAALDYLKAIGWEALREHEEKLTRRALELLAGDERFEVYGPRDLSGRGGIVSFNLKGVHAHDIGTALDLEGVAVRAGHHCCQPLMLKLGVPGTARASFYLYNTIEEVETMGRALRKAADFFLKPRPAPIAGGGR
jgi:cysteine desulfurase/selenocysteine lyase